MASFNTTETNDQNVSLSQRPKCLTKNWLTCLSDKNRSQLIRSLSSVL